MHVVRLAKNGVFALYRMGESPQSRCRRSPGALSEATAFPDIGRTAHPPAFGMIHQSNRTGGPALIVLAILFAAPLFFADPAHARQARISEDVRTLATYPFGDPDDVPMLVRDTRLYPYHAFTGYSHESTPREWKVVTLENEYIQVFVLPEVGGKVWGAIEKKSGREFIYRNEVMKFRNIALRGPWTSGGIEFNFGVIGHTPATATPVDYTLVTNDDGSVSCWVGAMDLPSRTTWRVEIRLPAESSAFETNVTFSNPTSLQQPYYNWMTGASYAQDDLEVLIPGNRYLTHPGEEMAWPVDSKGHHLPTWDENRFGGNKSYHVVGEYDDWFGGYYTNDDWGYGHWARFEDMPGQKQWFWALSRAGGIWEDLLTDTDGQYAEFQAGRMLVQYAPGDADNPISKTFFPPGATDLWTDRWFPVVETGGISDASESGVLHVTPSADGTSLDVRMNAFVPTNGEVHVFSGDAVASAVPFSAEPLTAWHATVPLGDRVRIDALDLEWTADRSHLALDRPFATPAEARASWTETERHVFEGQQLANARYYPEARAHFEAALAGAPWSRATLLELARLDLREAHYERGLEHARRLLQLDAHDPDAAFVAGALYEAEGMDIDARDMYSWAARSMTYRAIANTRLAEIALRAGRHDEALEFVDRALRYDTENLQAYLLRAIVYRTTGHTADWTNVLAQIAVRDPLFHGLHTEALLSGNPAEGFRAAFRSEFPDQDVMELSIMYDRVGRRADAVRLIDAFIPAAADPLLPLWLGYLTNDASLIEEGSLKSYSALNLYSRDPSKARPYRPETLPALEWAANAEPNWAWKWLKGLNLWALARPSEALELWSGLGEAPDEAAFYVARAHLTKTLTNGDPEPDLLRAIRQPGANRLTYIHLVRHYQDIGAWQQAKDWAASALDMTPGDFNLELLLAEAHVMLGESAPAVHIMDRTRVLPSENASESHLLYETAHLLRALDLISAGDPAAALSHVARSREWPERLGQGRPYETDERLADWIGALARNQRPAVRVPVDGAAPMTALLIQRATALTPASR